VQAFARTAPGKIATLSQFSRMPSEPRSAPALEAAVASVSALNRAARKRATPCGDGTMVWRVWGAGEPLVLLHGGYGSWTHWIRTIPELSQHYELWVPDMPGLGSSAMPPQPWTPGSIAGVIADGLSEIFLPQVGLRLVGFSFGGHIATLTAARLGRRVRDLTLVGVAALGLKSEPRAPFAKERTGMSWAERAQVHRHNLEILMFADPANIDALAVYLQTENVRRARFQSRPFAASDEIARTLLHVTAPLKTVWGTRDTIARPSVQARLDVLRRHHPELEARLIEGAGHWVMYEAPDAFRDALLDLLGTTARPDNG
jgi:2-hydroxy-6-oxonona-2,4-dienedioate hydrolase